MSTDDTLTLDDFLCFAVYSANHAFNRVYRPMLDRIGLTYPQYVVMVTLWGEDGMTVGQVGEKVLLETNTLTPLLKRLEAAGLVRRVRDTGDERQVRIFLTDQGQELRRAALEIPGEIGSCLERDMSEITALASQLIAVRDTLLARLKP
ncbi:MarR family winged helix-turn-helix transcriptional regulator [Ancylobacter pratisalsi]|uniref:MarR family transcriptional regulator n=1 Tax=Ancylobacter pratisalsi TaxID=1745854 RepID=A0A6P1YLX5_9HYPH|nr:MarR family transcriptional regulator [Ancylobacter pratisalsi]QIB34368.1 MarR family transcriptional regulator [Ancylobacter pratisalsi]